jgi:hypothetical protein
LHGLFPSSFPTKILHSLTIPMHATCTAHSIVFWFDHPSSILWRVQAMELLIVHFSQASRHFIPLRSRYSPELPVLRQAHEVVKEKVEVVLNECRKL